ncbi:DUF1983 domain-containing protein [Aeromonas veronii]
MAQGAIAVGAIVAGAVAGAVVASSMAPSLQQSDYSAGTNKSGADIELPIIYGNARCDGHLAFREVLNEPITAQTEQYVRNYLNSLYAYNVPSNLSGSNFFTHVQNFLKTQKGGDTDSSYCTFIYTFGEGPINAYNQLYIDDKPVFVRPMSITRGIVGYADIAENFRNHIQLEFSEGDRVNPHLSAIALLNSDNKWTDKHRGYGRPYVTIKVKLDPDAEIKGFGFSVQVKAEGRLVRDIRYNGNPVAYRSSDGIEVGRNGALCLLDYLTQSYGGGLNDSELMLDTFIEAANFCQINKLYIDGVVNQRQGVLENISEILTSFDGALTKINGLIGVVINQPTVSSYSFSTTTNIVAESVVAKFNSVDEYFNQLEVSVINQDKGKQDVVLYPPKIDDAVLVRDGKRIQARLKLPFTQDKNAIDLLASRAYMKAQYNTELNFTADLDGFLVGVYDVIDVTIPELKFNKKLFRIFKHEADIESGKVKISCREYNAAVYDTKYTGIVTPTNPTTPVFIRPVTNLKSRIVNFNDGFNVRLEWDSDDHRAIEYHVLYKLAADKDIYFTHYTVTKVPFVDLLNLNQTIYDFAVYAADLVGNPSKTVYLRGVDLKDDTILPAVTNVKLLNPRDGSLTETNSPDFIIKWDDMLDKVVKEVDLDFNLQKTQQQTVRDVIRYYEVDVYHSGNYKRTIITSVAQLNYTFNENRASGLSREVRFEVKIRGKGGALSPLGATSRVTVRNPQVAAPSGLSVLGGIAGIEAHWLLPQDLDYAGTEVHMSKTAGFIPSSSTLQESPSGTSFWATLDTKDSDFYYIRIGHFDIFGRDNINYSPQSVVSKKAVEDYMTNLKKDNLAKELLDEINNKVTKTELNETIKKEVGNVIIDINKDLTTIIKPQIEGLRTELNKEIGDRKTADTSLTKQFTDADTAMSLRIDAIKASNDKNNTDIAKANANIESVKAAYADADKALTTKIDKVSADLVTANGDIAKANAAITAEATTRATEVSAVSKKVDTVEANYKKADSDLKADYTAQITTISDETKRIASRVETVKVEAIAQAKTDSEKYANTEIAKSAAATLQTARGDIKTGDDAVRKAATDAAAQALVDAKADAAAKDVEVLKSAKAEVTNEATARQEADKVIAASVTKLSSDTTTNINAVKASIATTNTTVTNLQTSTATSINTLTSDVNGVKATVKTVADTTATIDGQLKSKYVLQTDANGVVAGIGLISDSQTKTSQVIFSADKLIFTNAKGDKFPLMEASGDSVKIRNAMIGQLESTNIRAGAIQAHHLAAGSIIADTIKANARIDTPLLVGATIDLGNIYMNSGAIGFGLGGPHGGWGKGWQTIIYAEGMLATNNIYATGSINIGAQGNAAGIQIVNNQILVRDAAGTVRVKIGYLG